MSDTIQLLTAAATGYLLCLASQWGEMAIKRRIYRNRRRRVAKMKYA
jgi:hypothetical protein